MSIKESKNDIYHLVEYQNASVDTQKIYDDSKKTLQLPFVLNWLKCQGSNPLILGGNWSKLKTTLLMGNIPNVLKQLIIYNVSKSRNCEYCTRAHKIFADSMSSQIVDDPDFLATESINSPLMPKSYKTAIKVVSKAALQPQAIIDNDIESLYNVGFDKSEVFELLSVADLVNMLNTIADVSKIKLDHELVALEK